MSIVLAFGREFFARFRSGLLWATLKKQAGISYPKSISGVRLREKPIPISKKGNFAYLRKSPPGWTALDGDYKAEETVVRPEAKRLIRQEMGRGSVDIHIPAQDFAECIAKALSFKSPENVITDEKLALAIDLYSNSFFEVSDNSKFIRLVTVLEALTPDSDAPEICKSALKDAKSAVKEHRKNFKKGTKERNDLDFFLTRLKLEKEAIGRSIERYASEIVRQNSKLGDADEVSDKLRNVYKHRSNLLHEGHTNEDAVREALTFLRDFLPKLLEQLYVSRANG